MARPKKKETLDAVSIRLPRDIMGNIEACAQSLQADTPLLQINRTDAVRYLIQLGLIEFEKQVKKKKK